MLVGEARELVLDGVLHLKRSINRTPYADSKVDHAAKLAINYLLRKTKLDKQSTTVATVASTATVDFSTPIGNFFHTPNLLHVRHSSDNNYKKVEQVDWEWMRNMRQISTSENLPTKIAFEINKTAYLDPIPDAAYTLTCVYWMPAILEDDSGTLFEWVPGTVRKGKINVPDEYLYETLWFGAAAALVGHERENPWARESWAKFEAYVRTAMSAGAPSGVMQLEEADYD